MLVGEKRLAVSLIVQVVAGYVMLCHIVLSVSRAEPCNHHLRRFTLLYR
jgi:hypothetical protein